MAPISAHEDHFPSGDTPVRLERRIQERVRVPVPRHFTKNDNSRPSIQMLPGENEALLRAEMAPIIEQCVPPWIGATQRGGWRIGPDPLRSGAFLRIPMRMNYELFCLSPQVASATSRELCAALPGGAAVF